MISYFQNIKKTIAVICILSVIPFIGVAQNTRLIKRNNAPVFQKLHKGVNVDISTPSRGVWPKIQYEEGLFKAVKSAGFESVRVFSKGLETEQLIKDAIANDLAIVVCLWGDSKWAKDPELGAKEIADTWRTMAKAWKDYPNDLVFEILNEPEGIGFKDESTFPDVMKLYNAAISAIREVDADRPILVGCPGYNDAEYLNPWVTEKYLTYTFNGGLRFYDDPNIGVAIHYYSPGGHDTNLGYPNFTMWTAALGNYWKGAIDRHFNDVEKWRNSQDCSNIPVVVTEWGCWLFDSRDKSQDLPKWLDYNLHQMEEHNMGSMWYTGIQNNQRSFGIYDSEFGWNQTVLDKLTGVTPTKLPKTNQVINGEFFQLGKAWKLSSDTIKRDFIYGEEAFSGNSMLKLTIPADVGGQLYLQTYGGEKEYKGAPGRTLLHLVKGQTYRISFIAASENQTGQIKVVLKDVKSNEVFYDSFQQDGKWIKVNGKPKTYTKLYKHNAETAMDVRLEFDFGKKQQVIYLDKVELIRN